MNILFISPNPVWGGAATANMSIAQMLSKDHKVYYNDEYNKISIDGIYYDNFPVHQCKDSDKLVSHILSIKADVVIWGIAMNLPYYKAASRIIRKQNIRQYLLFHSLAIIDDIKGKVMEWMVAQSLKHIDYLVFVSKYTDISWSKYKSVRKHPNHIVIYNPISLSSKSPICIQHSTNRIGFVGRFSEEKQPEIFAKLSMSNIKENTYIAWGDGILLQGLKNKYKSVKFMGQSQCQDEIYGSFDILVMTSKFENCPMVILEAWKYGIPCVVPNVGGIPEIVKDGYNSIIYNEYSEECILSCIDRIQNDYEKFSRNCLRDVQNYSFDTLVDHWNSILK